ncbi:hypothetical protein ASPZODRAFT_161688 [Penicilliopsis zonata CBS 506.65]|uniref:Uncharacterized protein n=1 Tax=Penicilliopsis zonata CBS 506.65 TaxID=1073090 RepID=A0A1L9S8I9_9EURO|nr:hypothetical protein ASPZODRAFT_161688 [Penicilliopsis zonata CBS 506.65]OJJ43467.1 hypothetical protein ASPZODRAFT_161688 [Penicilliopsis zonata CBS 506.65]
MSHSMDLVREVERLVTAPYAPSLQDLHALVHDASSGNLHAWAAAKPCQVGLLVDVLVEGLSRSTFALPLLASLASVPLFRNAVLERYPSLLNEALAKTVEGGEREYMRLCTWLLSSPLPSELVLPASLSSYILKLVEQMSRDPCMETILPVYQLFHGLKTSPSTLRSLSSQTMSTIQVEFTKTLRNIDDHMGNLLCLATFSHIVSATLRAPVNKEHGSIAASPLCSHWLQQLRHFFGPKRALKTLDLVVLRVILACSASCNGLTTSQAAESIRLAIEICDAVEPEQKAAWVTGNGLKIAKLCAKVTRDDINPEIQMMGLVFTVFLLPPCSTPQGISRLAQQILVQKDCRTVLETIPQAYISRLVEAATIASGESAICTFLDYVFSALKNQHSVQYTSLATLQVANCLVNSLKGLGTRILAPTVIHLVSSLGRVILSEALRDFPRKPGHRQCTSFSICEAALISFQNQLLIDAFDFYCSVGIFARSTDSIKETMFEPSCSFSKMKAVDHRHGFSLKNLQNSLPDVGYPRRDWRNTIAESLMENARISHERLLKNVEDACRDLENRCFDNEGPLREVEQQREKLVSEKEELRVQRGELEIQLQQALCTISSLQKEVATFEKRAESASNRVEELTASLTAAQRELEEQRRDSQESAHLAEEKSRSRELDLIATVTEKEDQLDGLQEYLREQRAANEDIQISLDAVMKEKDAILDDSAALRREMKQMKTNLDGCELLSRQKVQEIQELSAGNDRLALEIVEWKKQLDNKASESDRLRASLRALEENFNTEMDALKQRHKQEVSEVTIEATKYKDEGLVLREAMQMAASSANQELQTKDRRISHLEQKVQSMRNERAAKAREFSEAQQHIGRLMTVMGFKGTAEERQPVKTNTNSNKHHRSKSQHAAAPQAESFQILPDEMQSQNHDMLGVSFGSVASDASGPSPKRSRNVHITHSTRSEGSYRRSPRASHEQVPFQSSSRSASSQQRKDRLPLGDANSNSPHTSQESTHNASKHASQGRDEALPDGQAYLGPHDVCLQDFELDLDLDLSRDSLF